MPAPESGHLWEYYRYGELFDEMVGERLPGRALEAEREHRTLKQVVVVGAGGTGVEILTNLKKSVRHFYRPLGEVAEMVQFVSLDAQPLSKQSEQAQQILISGSEYLHIGGFSGLDFVNANYGSSPDLQRWWDRSYPIGAVRIEEGCKRIRQLGKLCLYRSRGQVETAITDAINRARALDQRAVRNLNLPPLTDSDSMRFYVISGSCGGTGSGMFLDLCYLIYRAARAQGIAAPRVRCLIIMPTLYIEEVRREQPMLVNAFQSNAYAFFKELQYFIRHGGEFYEHCMNSRELIQRGLERLDDWRSGERIYLIDNNIGGQVLQRLEDVFTLAADMLFHIMITPLGLAEDGVGVTNIDAAILGELQGRTKGFSSAGVSYIAYPVKTIGRCLLAAYLRDIIYLRLTRDINQDDRDSAAGYAAELFQRYSHILDVRQVARTTEQQALSLLEQSFPNRRWIEEQEKTQRKKWEAILADAERLITGLSAQALSSVAEVFNHYEQGWLGEFSQLVQGEVNNCSGSDCIYYTRAVLRRLRHLVGDIAIPRSNLDVTETTTMANNAKSEVTSRARKLAILRRTAKIKSALSDFIAAKQQLARHDVAGRTAEMVNQYRSAAIQILDQAIARTDAIHQQLRRLGDAMDDQSDEYDPSADERLLTATTQLVPEGGVEGAVREELAELSSSLEQDVRAFLVTPEAPIWALGSGDTDSQRRAVEETLRDLLNVGLNRVASLLRQRVDQVALQSLEADDFTNRVLANMDTMAQPAWRLNLDAAGMRIEDCPFIQSVAKPEDMDVQLLPRSIQRDTKSLDDRKIMLLRSQHGVPLHAMVGLQILHGTYRSWVKNPDHTREPAHTSKEWNRGAGLEDAFPEVTVSEENLRYFALGMFTDYLVRESRLEVARKLVENLSEHGYVYRRGPNQYIAVMLQETADETLRKVGEKILCPGAEKKRPVAARNFDFDCVASAKTYMERLESMIAWDDLEKELNTYITRLYEESTLQGRPKEQLQAEARVLEEYLGQG